MTSSMQELLSLVPPPEEPKDAKGDWNKVEGDLGLGLPEDYKQFITHYGRGTLCNLFWFASPFNCVDPTICVGPKAGRPVSAREYWTFWAGIYNDWGKTERNIPFPVYPTTPGLFPWGIYGDTDVLSWYTLGEPQQWEILYLDRQSRFLELKGLGFLGFLLAALKGTVPLPDDAFGKDMLDQPRVYTPH